MLNGNLSEIFWNIIARGRLVENPKMGRLMLSKPMLHSVILSAASMTSRSRS
jgi:hypothetical protein